jgi:hypothetical protein
MKYDRLRKRVASIKVSKSSSNLDRRWQETLKAIHLGNFDKLERRKRFVQALEDFQGWPGLGPWWKDQLIATAEKKRKERELS